MKLIDIMKRYNKCILKENAKLRSIYNTLIRECDGADTDNEFDVSECGDKEENECDVNETEGTKMSVAEFLGECGKENPADDSSEKEQIDEVNDGDLMTAEEFFGGGKTKADECDACGDDSCKNGEKCGLKEDDDEKIEEEDDDEEIEEEDNDEEIEEDEELISKKEFYAANESDDEKIEEEDDEEIEEEDEDAKEIEEDEDAEKDVTESKKNDKEAKLSESLEKHYRAANRKLFNF